MRQSAPVRAARGNACQRDGTTYSRGMVQDVRTILMVEDSAGDAILLQHCFKNILPDSALHWVSDGNEAILYLCGHGRYADREQYPIPALILLDLKLPVKNGFEVLRFARGYPAFASIPVIVYSDCFDPQIVKRAYELGANSYLRKALDPESRVRLVRALKDYWLEMNMTPQPSVQQTVSELSQRASS
jgi:CheY-like chemotaxis protein